ncbi:HAD-IIB family hydrolase [Deinococcus aquatilis]|uniref:HAD-IIB family hydrolase n=1 Tax=Deinococcus aquatilis TaxID=519440 RepID=UPI00036A4B75|nr:HAD-IIB family hydrolase [Deinococcus aquatilis]
MSTIVAFADLDDTLFQTLRKLPGADPRTLTPATVNTQGEAHSFCTPTQAELLRLLACGGVTVIPVTGRDLAAMARVTLPFSSWRIVDHGLTLIAPDGAVDAEWAAHVRAHLHDLQDALAAATAHLEAHAARLGCRLTRHHAHQLPFMTVLKHPEAHAGALEELQLRWEGFLVDQNLADLQIIANANNVSVLPRSLGKLEAVQHLRQRQFSDAVLTFGLGDSLSDLAFMSACDFAVTPPRGQLLRAVNAARLPQR